MIGIYKITNKINGKSYIGQSIDVERRFLHHKKYRRTGEKNKSLYRAIKKYGIENFSFEIIDICRKEELDKKETYYIEKYGTFKNGYNMTKGGESILGYEFTKKSIEKRVQSVKNYYKKHSRSEESREKVRNSLKKYYNEHPEVRKIIGLQSKGRKMPKEIVKRVAKANSRKVVQYDLFGNFVKEYNSMIEAGKMIKIHPSAISAVCRGVKKTAGGFIWGYKKLSV